MASIKNGQAANADDVMNALGANFNDIAQNLFNADYIGFDSRLSNNTAPSLKNVAYSTFTSNDADINYGFVYDSSNDMYVAPDLGDDEYIIIEATSLSAPWTSNNCKTVQFDTGKWLVYCTTGTAAVQRAQIIKSLFFGTAGTNSLILDFTSVTAVKTSHANDVGKRGHYADIIGTTTGGEEGYYTGTFADTSDNTDCSSWSNCGAPEAGEYARWEIPSGTTRNTVSGIGTSDEIGTDTTGDELNNPATCQLETFTGAGAPHPDVQVVVLCKGDVVWVESGLVTSTSDIDFYTDHSIPDMTAVGSISDSGIDTLTLIFKDTVASTDNAIPVINSSIDATSSEQISVSANGGSNWTNVNNAEIARPTAGTALWRRIVITRTDLDKEDEVTEQAVKYELY